MHFVKDCPHRSKAEEQITLFFGNQESDMYLFTSEARNSTVLDSGCTSSVAGQDWLNCFIDCMNENDVGLIKKAESSKVFKFREGEEKKSKESVILPCKLAGKDVMIKTHNIDSDIPLFLRKDATKTAKIKLDLENDNTEILGEEVNLEQGWK